MLTINGAMGEGGGQILRTALALSLCLKRPFVMINIRQARERPGLMRQHLAAVKAAAAVGRAHVNGAALGSRRLVFEPTAIHAGDYRFDIGSAGSTTLVLQTILPALLQGCQISRVVLEGGTHNPLAPPYDFLANAFLPLLHRMGAQVSLRLLRPGFYPAGGGCIEAVIEPQAAWRPLRLKQRGAVQAIQAEVLLARLPRHIARRELAVLADRLPLSRSRIVAYREREVSGPGNVAVVTVACQQVTEVFTGFGMRGVRAEEVAEGVAAAAQRYLEAGVPVGVHLADQLLLPVALAGGGSYLTLRPSRHTLTNMEVLGKFMEISVSCQQQAPDAFLISIGHAGP